jgi:nicotinamide-nucleotide amidase
MFDPNLIQAATALLAECRSRGLMLATAESCTGGLIAAVLTEIAGSSDVLDRGFVTYSNAAKSDMLGVPPELIEADGAVSGPVAASMATGALLRSQAALAVAVTGVAGPGGGSESKPVGTVWFGIANRGSPTLTERQVFPGDRAAVRRATVEYALAMLSTAARRQ